MIESEAISLKRHCGNMLEDGKHCQTRLILPKFKMLGLCKSCSITTRYRDLHKLIPTEKNKDDEKEIEKDDEKEIPIFKVKAIIYDTQVKNIHCRLRLTVTGRHDRILESLQISNRKMRATIPNLKDRVIALAEDNQHLIEIMDKKINDAYIRGIEIGSEGHTHVTISKPSIDTEFDKLEDRVIHEDDCSDCVICLNPIFKGERVKKIICDHVYHSLCLYRHSMVNMSCPLCRFPLIRKLS